MRGVLVFALVGCATHAPAPAPFVYSASVAWSAPEIESVTFDGTTIASGFQFEDTVATFDDALALRHAVIAATTTGTMAFRLAPTECGGQCGNTIPSCDELASETEGWDLNHGQGPPPPAGTPLSFDATSGSCGFPDGRGFAWAW